MTPDEIKRLRKLATGEWHGNPWESIERCLAALPALLDEVERLAAALKSETEGRDFATECLGRSGAELIKQDEEIAALRRERDELKAQVEKDRCCTPNDSFICSGREKAFALLKELAPKMTTPELLPCPFCGGRPQLSEIQIEGQIYGFVLCAHCTGEGPSCQYCEDDAVNETRMENAMLAWNRRAPLPAGEESAAEIASLKSIIQHSARKDEEIARLRAIGPVVPVAKLRELAIHKYEDAFGGVEYVKASDIQKLIAAAEGK